MRNPKLLAALGMTAALALGGAAGAALGNPLASGASTSTAAPTTTTVPGRGTADRGPGGHRIGPMGPMGRMGMGQELDAAAKALHLTTDQLRAELAKGKSLAEVAKDQGVSRQDLIDALVKAAEARLDEAKKHLPDIMGKVVDAKRPSGTPGPGGGTGSVPPWGHGGDRHGPGGPGGAFGRPLDPAAKALGMSTDDLRKALEGGSTIAQVAKDKGVAPQKVIDALVAQAKTRLDQAVKDGRITAEQEKTQLDRITTAITAMVNGQGPKGWDHHN